MVTRSTRITDAKTLGFLLREARQHSGLTQRELAEVLEVSQRYIVELERGKPTKAIERLLSFARETGITLFAEIEPTTRTDST